MLHGRQSSQHSSSFAFTNFSCLGHGVYQKIICQYWFYNIFALKFTSLSQRYVLNRSSIFMCKILRTVK